MPGSAFQRVRSTRGLVKILPLAVLLGIACSLALGLEGVTPLRSVPSLPPNQAACDRTAGKNNSVAICVVTRDQHEDLIEWVEHHLKLGVSKIYLFDHGSHPPLVDTLSAYTLFGQVVHHWVPSYLVWRFLGHTKPYPHKHRVNVQEFAYKYCIKAYSPIHQWIAFIDTDEFLILKDRSVKDLPTFMEPYKPYGGLTVNWMTFGTSGHKVRPNGTVVANYWKCNPDSRVKTIANTDYVVGTTNNPHIFVYKPGYVAVSPESFRPIRGPFCSNCSRNAITLYHYVTKSEAEFNAKVLRGSGTGLADGPNGGRRPEYLQEADKAARFTCTDGVSLMEGRTWNPPVGLASLQPQC